MPKKANVTLGPIFCSEDEVVVLRAGFLTVAGTLVDWAFADRERRGWSHQGPGNLAVPVSYTARIANSPASECWKGVKPFGPWIRVQPLRVQLSVVKESGMKAIIPGLCHFPRAAEIP